MEKMTLNKYLELGGNLKGGEKVIGKYGEATILSYTPRTKDNGISVSFKYPHISITFNSSAHDLTINCKITAEYCKED